MNPVRYFRRIACTLMVTLYWAALTTAQNRLPSTPGVAMDFRLCPAHVLQWSFP